MAQSSGKIEWFLHDGEREIGPLTEVELRRRLKHARRDKLRVRQNDGRWYPAKEVVRKFRELAENGIYVKLGTVAGPYTAEKAYALLDNLSLDGVQAKIGLHGSWVPAARLLARLRKAIEKSTPQSETVAVDQAATVVDVESDDEIIPRDPLGDQDDQDDQLISLEPIGEVNGDEVFDLTSPAAAAPLEPLADADAIPLVEPIRVQPLDEEAIPLVQPIAHDPIPIVQPIDTVPVVEPIEVRPVQQQMTRQLSHWCACGREVRVMPQHTGMTMQCPACKRTFVAGGRR
jgi:hypothetical protein